jgi:hypothetical protein
MRLSLARAIIAVVVIVWGLESSHAAECAVGVNVNSFQNFSAPEQDAILQQLKKSGVHCVRTSFRPDEKDLTLMRQMQDAGIGLVIVVGPVFLPKAPARPANPLHHMRSAMPLTWSDPVASKIYYQSLFDKLDAKGIKLTGVELGNEFNWTDFNGDFPVPGQGKAFTLADLSHDPEAEKVARGLLLYLKVLAELKDARDHSQLNQHAPLISAGMAAVSNGPWLKKMGVDGISIPATYAFSARPRSRSTG